MKMGKKVREYKAGDFIFAKVKGYPAWPARVQRPNGKKYFVYFYGTGETANLPPNMIFDYAENKDKFLSKSVKRRDFNDGVRQIEHDFANNVPIEQVIGVLPMEVPDDSANDTANDSAINDTMDETVADTTAANDTTVADESAVNTTAQGEPMVEDSDDAGALVIDEGKQKGRKSTPTAKSGKETPKPGKEPKTPRGKKKDEEESKAEDKDDKKEEEIVSRSGRKIRPKRYMDEQTEENATLPSPAPKKRRGASPAQDKEKEKEDGKADSKPKIGKQYNAVTQAELEDMKEPFQSDPEKENILIAYLPAGQYVGVQLFQARPAACKSEPARLQWDRQQVHNAIALKLRLERGQITPQSVITQLVMDLNLTDEEKATLDKERETEEKKSRVQFLKTEMKLIELEAKIKTCLCLEKADTELCLKLLDEFTELDIKPLMLLKHPSCGETVKRLRAYVGNTPSWELSESAALLFAKQAHRIRRRADAVYRRVKELFTVPEGLSFWEFFSERVEQFKKATAKLSSDELLELVHEPLEMSMPTSHTMKAAVDAANEEEPAPDDGSAKKKPAAKPKSKLTNNSTPSKPAVKRQSSRKQQEEKEKEQSPELESETAEKNDKDAESIEQEKDSMETEQTNDKEETSTEEPAEDKLNKDTKEDKVDCNKDDDTKTQEDGPEKEDKDDSDKGKAKDDSDKAKDDSDKVKAKDDSDKGKAKDDSEKVTKKNSSNKDKSKSKSPSPNEKDVGNDSTKDGKDGKNDSKDVKANNDKAEKGKDEKIGKEKIDKAEEKEKEKEDEPRAKRSRDSKKTDAPPPRSPMKRKSKC